MSSGNVFESLYKCQASINKLVVDGQRSPENVLRYIQRIVDGHDFDSSDPRWFHRHMSLGGWLGEWMKFYYEVFDFAPDFSEVKMLPNDGSGYNWLVIVAKGLTLNRVWATCVSRFPSVRSTYSNAFGNDMDKAVPSNDRMATNTYSKRFRNRVEADEEYKGISVVNLPAHFVTGITLLERLLLELWYHWRFQGHLDLKHETLCAGSRDFNGNSPTVYYFGEGSSSRLTVWRSTPNESADNRRARNAI